MEKLFIVSFETIAKMEYNYLPTNFNVNTCNLISDSNESVVFQQTELFPGAFPIMEEIRRQGKLCDVVLKVVY